MRPSSSAGPEVPRHDPGMPGDVVVVTGVGVISAAGTGAGAWVEALESGTSVARDVSPEGAPRPIRAGAIAGFSVRDFGSFRGTAGLSRTAQLAVAATSLAQREASLSSPIPPGERVGVVLSTSYGNLESMVRFDRGARREGHRFVDPMIFPNTVVNAAAGHVSILLGFSALNSTVSSGATGGLHALAYAAEVLRRGDADLVFAGGAEELSYWTWLGEEERRGSPAAPGERKAIFPGEGAAVVALERAADARSRGARALARVAGGGQSFAGAGSPEGVVLSARASALRGALLESGREPAEVDCVWSGAESLDGLEREAGPALREIFGKDGGIRVALAAPILGDWQGASASLQAAAAARFLDLRRLPPTVALRGVPAAAPARPARTVLVSASDRLGGNAAAVLTLPPADEPREAGVEDRHA